MATDAFIVFKGSDGIANAGLYVKHNTNPEDFIPHILEFFKKHDMHNSDGRLNWNQMVTLIIKEFIDHRVYCHLVQPRDVIKEDIMIHHIVVSPIADKYEYMGEDIGDGIHINHSYRSGKQRYYGSLNDFMSGVTLERLTVTLEDKISEFSNPGMKSTVEAIHDERYAKDLQGILTMLEKLV